MDTLRQSMVTVRRAVSSSSDCCMLVQAGPSIAKQFPQLSLELAAGSHMQNSTTGHQCDNNDRSPAIPLDAWLHYRMVPEIICSRSNGWRACNPVRLR